VPTKKQRRRQEKNRRHEWEYVYVDDEGQEVEVDPGELRRTKEDKQPRTGPSPQRTNARGRAPRQIEPPSWRRVGRRALFLAPVFVVVMLMLNRDQSVAARLAPAVFLLLFFIPFSYFTDSLAYRMYKKRLANAQASPAKPKPKPKTR
jgi:hypothetical protein